MTLHPATLRQIDAARPAASVWLSANAGSGKTKVLTDRVARLLFAGVDPQNILCLTYTKAAASEMQNRLFNRLGSWAMQDDAALGAELRGLGIDEALTPERLRHARTLFAQAMEVPGGLKIQTIHSFCASLLRRFPLEAGISPQFTEMEDRTAQLLRAEVVDGLALGAGRAAVDALARYFTGEEFDKVLAGIAHRRAALSRPPDEGVIRAALGLAPGLTEAALLAATLQDEDRQVLADLVDLCRTGGANDQKAADKLARAARHWPPNMALLAELEGVFLNGDSAKIPHSAKIGSFPTKALRAAQPDLMLEVEALMERVEAAREDRLRLAALDRTLALYRFANAFVPAYEAAKLRRGMLDFDDLIQRAGALLTDPAVAQWVLFRLDGGIDHILVDEAQDTSPEQWAVIRNLAQEFAAGEGAWAGRERTIFVVSDKKQSIYSFQGADPDALDRMQAHFAEELTRIDRFLAPMVLEHSFRSAFHVLRAVDLTFAGPMRDGLGQEDPHHIAFHEAMPGRVDLWPAIPKTEDDKDEREWHDPVDRPGPRHHTVLLAEAIADAAAEMVKTGTVPARKGDGYIRRPITEGDILILVQRRSDLFAGIIRALKARGLRVAGADRLRVGAELAVRDIAALLRFLALQDDDLSLAEVLKSPLFGWSEQQLFTLAHRRPEGATLWQALRGSDAVETLAVLDDLRREADFLRPYDLINRILTRHDGRRKLLARLGPEAEDGIDALLSQALSYEQGNIPGLTGFLEWMQTDDLEVKRQTDSAGDQIRVMTVHGAKGLESPVVILPDTAKRVPKSPDPLYAEGDCVLWAPSVPEMPPELRTLRDARIEAQNRERRRLLYVAMTRAETWLVVCAAGETGSEDESWHAMVEAGLREAGAAEQDFPTGRGLRYSAPGWDELPFEAVAPLVAPAIDQPDPGVPLPFEGQAGTRSPSDLGGAKVMPGDPGEDDTGLALARGRIVHLLLEHLPDIAPAGRADHARALIAGATDPEVEALGDPSDLIAQTLAMMAQPELSTLFAPETLAEVDITAPVGTARLHGAIDRLILSPGKVMAVDFKTNRLAPETGDEVPEGILRQMGAYQSMLEQVFPGDEVQVAILWTATARLMPLSRALVMAALQRAGLT
ncbi:MAG: double-strand break repair helicase AddA [Rubellimicrobium sp.]|nr:double-strand break repair helicase AddA [Rubellimicrobium sp.]